MRLPSMLHTEARSQGKRCSAVHGQAGARPVCQDCHRPHDQDRPAPGPQHTPLSTSLAHQLHESHMGAPEQLSKLTAGARGACLRRAWKESQ
jgi:hypothetical protein